MSAISEVLDTIGLVPALPGARCRGRHQLFDPPDRNEDPSAVKYRHDQALALCGSCPAFASCRAWLDQLPDAQRPDGVIAGIVNGCNAVGRPSWKGYGNAGRPKCGRPNSRGRPCRFLVKEPGQPCEHHDPAR